MDGFGVMIDAMIDAVFQALGMAFAMGWEILWPLILGFALSGVVQAVVSHSEMSRLLPDDIVFLALAVLLVWRFMRTGGPEMLRMMNSPAHSDHA